MKKQTLRMRISTSTESRMSIGGSKAKAIATSKDGGKITLKGKKQ
jgi:hypothetical protein